MAPTILLIEPSSERRSALVAILEEAKIVVCFAESVEEALESNSPTSIDLLLIGPECASHTAQLSLLDTSERFQHLSRWILTEDPQDEPAPDPNAFPPPPSTLTSASRKLPAGDPSAIARALLRFVEAPSLTNLDRMDFRGSLQQVGVVDLLRLLGMNRRTGALSLTTPAGAGEIRLIDGHVVDAVYRRVEGTKALYRLLAETEGSFAFVSGAPALLRRIQQPLDELLSEGSRQAEEVTLLSRELAIHEDALQAVSSSQVPPTVTEAWLMEALASPRTVVELLDQNPQEDIHLLRALRGLVDKGLVRRIEKAALFVPLSNPDAVAGLALAVNRIRRPGFSGNPRLVLCSEPTRLSTLLHAMGRIAEFVLAAESPPPAPVPYPLGTLRLTDDTEVDIIGLPNKEEYSPLWGLTLPGSGAVVLVSLDRHDLLVETCAQGEIPLFTSASLVGPLEEADPRQVAALLCAALETAAGR